MTTHRPIDKIESGNIVLDLRLAVSTALFTARSPPITHAPQGSMMYALRIPSLLLAISPFVLTSCSGGGGGGGGGTAPIQPPTNNLAAMSVSVASPEARAGYFLELDVELHADELSTDVGVSVYAINKADYDQSVAEPRQLFVGAAIIDQVAPGTATERITVNIPANIPEEEYIFLAILDELGVIAETEADEEDNSVATVVPLEKLEFPNLPADKEPVNVFVDEAILDSTVLMLDFDDYLEDAVQNPDAGVTLIMGVEGTDDPIATEVFGTLRFARSDNSSTYEVPLFLWDTAKMRYTFANGVDPDDPFGQFNLLPPEWMSIGEIAPQLVDEIGATSYSNLGRSTAHVDLYFPGKLTRTIVDALDDRPIFLAAPPNLTIAQVSGLMGFLNAAPDGPQVMPGTPLTGVTRLNVDNVVTSSLVLEVRPIGSTHEDRYAEDSVVEQPFQFILPPPSPPPPVFPYSPNYGDPIHPVAFDKGFRNCWNSSSFGYDVNFSSQKTADLRGLITSGGGGVSVKAFGKTFEFVKIEARAQILPTYEGMPMDQDPGFTMLLAFGGQTLFSRDEPATFTSSELIFSTSKSALKDSGSGALNPKTFRKFPIPFKVTPDIAGVIGISYQVTLSHTELVLIAKPFAVLEGSLTAEVNLGIASAGAIGTLTLVRENFRIRGSASLDLSNNGLTGGTVDFLMTPRLQLENDLAALGGSVSLFLNFSRPGVCRRKTFLGSVPYPCFKDVTLSHTIAKFDPLLREQTKLLDLSTDIRLIIEPGEPAIFYAPPDPGDN